MAVARAELESLLRARKLDVTLTTAAPWRAGDEERLAPAGWPAIDDALGGGLARGHLSEIVGSPSAGRTAVFGRIAAAAAARGEAVALIDTHDRFDPASAAAAGLALDRLLWVRDTGDAERAVKAMNLVLQAGGFGVVALDLSDVAAPAIRRFPHTTWLRVSRVIEGGQTVALLLGREHIARSPGGVTIALEAPDGRGGGAWQGSSRQARRLAGLPIRPRVLSARAR